MWWVICMFICVWFMWLYVVGSSSTMVGVACVFLSIYCIRKSCQKSLYLSCIVGRLGTTILG